MDAIINMSLRIKSKSAAAAPILGIHFKPIRNDENVKIKCKHCETNECVCCQSKDLNKDATLDNCPHCGSITHTTKRSENCRCKDGCKDNCLKKQDDE